jgi:hypothetical protein
VSILRFESEEALQFTLTSGLVPARIVQAPARMWRDDAAIIIVPEGAVPPDTMKALAAAGVGRLPNGKTPSNARAVRCWAELVPLVRTAESFDPEATVLFFLPLGTSMVGLAGELVRLGCDRLEHRSLPDGHLLRASAPPYYSVLRAIDGASGVQAFVAALPGQA